MRFDPSAIRRYTTMTERLVASVLKRTGEVGLCDEDNRRAYRWRLFELRWPRLSKLIGLFFLGPRIAFGKP